MPSNYKIHCLLETLSPLTHMMGTNGNEAIINREAVLYNKRICHIPVISGNALRHKMIREPGAFYLINACDLEGKMGIDQLNFMFNGGSLVESSVSCNINKISDMKEKLPLYQLLGGCLRNQIVSGSLNVGRGMLVCRENIDRINSLLPEEFQLAADIFSSDRFIAQYQYTRGDAVKMKDFDLLAELDEQNEAEKEKSHLMIYNGQSIVAGSLFYINLVVNNANELEIGSLLHAMSNWNGMIGGQGSRGHGKCRLSIINCNIDIDRCVDLYTAHVDKNKDGIKAWLFDTFPVKKEKSND